MGIGGGGGAPTAVDGFGAGASDAADRITDTTLIPDASNGLFAGAAPAAPAPSVFGKAAAETPAIPASAPQTDSPAARSPGGRTTADARRRSPGRKNSSVVPNSPFSRPVRR